jgi:lipopolysaccharide transport system ATP-binding protein
MYMRLAFAVAAYLEPEILIVDEVLSVGDFAFQQKCLGKMEAVATGGRTVLFVSQNTSMVAALCNRAYLLEEGRIAASGSAPDVVQRYLTAARRDESTPIGERGDRQGDGSVRITSLRVENADGRPVIGSSDRVMVTVGYECDFPLRSARFQVILHDEEYYGLYRLDTSAEGGLPELLPARGSLTCTTDPINLTPGRCGLTVAVHRGAQLADYLTYAGAFDVQPDGFFPSGRMPTREVAFGVLRHRWEVSGAEDGRLRSRGNDGQ